MDLLFDLGGVIMDIDKNRCVEAFTKLGMTDIDRFLGDYAQKGPFKLLEEGKITPAEFRDTLRRHIPGREVSDAELDSCFMRFLIGIPDDRLDALRRLRAQGRRLYLLSNTNAIMWHAFIASEFRKQGLDIDSYFDGILTSFEVGVLKPDPRIFQQAISRFSLKPADTLFLDDSEANCEAARRLGLNAACVRPGTEFTQYI